MREDIRELLRELERAGRAHDERETERSRKMLNLHPETAELISILAQSSRAKHVLEIGTSNGYSTIWLAASVREAGGRVITVDRNAEKHTLARANLAKAGLTDCVELRVGEATGVVASLPGPFDLIFFDADRLSAPDQLRSLLPKLLPKALLLADNALSHPEEISGYLSLIRELKLQHVIVPTGNGLSVALAG